MEFISNNTIIPKLVEWFNAQQNDSDKTIGSSEIAIFKVKITEDGGEVSFTVNPDPSVSSPGTYIGEVVYMWAGARGDVAVADEHSFIEISKYLAPVAPEPVTFVTPGVA